jgi:eukaryotic-like serine/threonine-protein kinase
MSGGVDTDTVVDGRYRIMGRLGSGGMADVYCAEDLQLGRKVALKLLYRRFAEAEQFVERFRREASAAAGLQHPNVVSVYDRGEWDGTYYIAMEYLEGEPLKTLIQRQAPLDPLLAIDLTAQILRAVRFAHRRGVIHRDIKPHNVIVDGEGRAKVTDFGIALAGASDMTETGSIMGTAQYLSPEQAQGHAVSGQSDLYSVGIVLYEMLTGRVPFEGDTAVAIALKQVAELPLPPRQLVPSVPPALEDVVLRALAKDPSHRFPDADAFIAALEQARATVGPDGAAVAAGPATSAFAPVAEVPVLVEDPERRRSRWPWVVAGVVLAALAVALVLFLTDAEEREVPRVVGANSAVAARVLRDAGFTADVTRVRSDRPEDRVIGQDPAPGTELEEGSTVALTVSAGPGTEAVPDVEGRPLAEARAALEQAGFETRTRRVFSDDVATGRVISTTPPGGTQAERGSRVTLVVSRGPEQVQVPDVTGQSLDDARAALERLGLETAVQREESADAEPGNVLRQDPAGGAEVDAGTTVTLTVAREVEEVEVPSVVGRTQDEATEALSGAGFEVDVGREEVQTPDEDGVVLRQTPSQGRAERGSQVRIVVGRFDPDLDPDPQPGDEGTAPDDGGDTGGTEGAGTSSGGVTP